MFFHKINPLHFLLDKTQTGRRIAIGDIHGCCKTLKTLLLEKVKITKDDQIIFLGDYLHRGDDSAGVMDFIMDLQAQNYQVYPLKGNHEQMALEKDAQARKKWESMSDEERIEYEKEYENVPRLVKLANFADKNRIIFPKYMPFLDNLFLCCQMPDFVFTHAGLNFKSPNPFIDFEAMLWERDNDESVPEWLDFRIVHGHTPIPLADIQKSIEEKAKCINIDNGCYKGVNSDNISVQMGYYGNLCALDIDNWVLHMQKCLDIQAEDDE
jgi:serine/threonine protein phosphatase 1